MGIVKRLIAAFLLLMRQRFIHKNLTSHRTSADDKISDDDCFVVVVVPFNSTPPRLLRRRCALLLSINLTPRQSITRDDFIAGILCSCDIHLSQPSDASSGCCCCCRQSPNRYSVKYLFTFMAIIDSQLHATSNHINRIIISVTMFSHFRRHRQST